MEIIPANLTQVYATVMCGFLLFWVTMSSQSNNPILALLVVIDCKSALCWEGETGQRERQDKKEASCSLMIQGCHTLLHALNELTM